MFFFCIASILNLPSEIELAIKHPFYHNFFFKFLNETNTQQKWSNTTCILRQIKWIIIMKS